jgi:period circadian protein 2
MDWDKKQIIPRPNPHWLDNVDLTNELVYRYQIDAAALNDVLNADLFALKNVNQVKIKTLCKIYESFIIKISDLKPDLVNAQLNQLYLDLEIEGLTAAKLSLESSGSSGDEETTKRATPRRKSIRYSKLVLIYEENCPLPASD